MHYMSRLINKRQRPLKGRARRTLLGKCFVGKYMAMHRSAHPQVTDCSFADKKGLLCLDLFNTKPRNIKHEYTINPPHFKVCMDLLKEVPSNVPWLMKLNERGHTKLIQTARDHGVDPECIIFASWLPRVEDHLDRYRLDDLSIDTFPCNGHTTAGDSLRAGLLLISLCGGSFASRVVESLLHDVGMPDLDCYSFHEYDDKALHIETNEASGGITRGCCRFESIKRFGHLHQPHRPMP